VSVSVQFQVTIGVAESEGDQHDIHDSLEAHLDDIMEHLVTLADTGCEIADPAIALDESTNSVTFELLSTGDDFDSAVETARACIRSAIHAAGGFTPTWDTQRSQHAAIADEITA
jgi:hypothetical protein